jgi:hypothetical protein
MPVFDCLSSAKGKNAQFSWLLQLIGLEEEASATLAAHRSRIEAPLQGTEKSLLSVWFSANVLGREMRTLESFQFSESPVVESSASRAY